MRRTIAVLALACPLALGRLAAADPAVIPEPLWQEVHKLTAREGVDCIRVALDGDTLVVQTAVDDEKDGRQSTRIFHRTGNTWTAVQDLPGAPIPAECWGVTWIDLDGDTLLLGRYVYVRKDGRFVLEQEIRAADGTPVEPVQVSGDTIVAQPAPGSHADRAWVFVRQGGRWRQQAVLAPDDHAPEFAAYENRTVAIAGDTIVVGAPSSEAAYVFGRERGTWSLRQRLAAPTGNRFGFGVAVDGSTVVVRSNGRDYLVVSGRNLAWIFEKRDGTWVRTAKLRAPDYMFGRDLVLDGDDLVLGVKGFGGEGANISVNAYPVQRRGNTWSLPGRIALPGQLPSGGPGRHLSNIALDRGTLVIGTVTGDRVGEVRVFQRR